MTLRDVLTRLTEERIDLGRSFTENLRIAVGHFERQNGDVPLADLSPHHVRAMMRAMLDRRCCPRTVNNYRASILYLWEQTENLEIVAPVLNRKKIRKIKETPPFPTAWREDQLGAILKACRQAPTKRGWGPDHWRLLVLVCYETSLRIGCLLASDVSQLDVRQKTLFVPAHLQKNRAATLQPLQPETARDLAWLHRANDSQRLFPWPFHPDELWRRFRREVLQPAGLPTTRRDLFHRLRRTSYTYVTRMFGKEAAREHAGHKQDLSSIYCDPTLLDRPNPLSALPKIEEGE